MLERKNKILTILVVVLVILNITTLSYFTFFKKKPKRDKGENFVTAMQKDLNLTTDQVASIENIRTDYKIKIDKNIDSIRFYKDSIYFYSLQPNIEDSVLVPLFERVGQLRAKLEHKFFKQSSDVRKVLTPNQVTIFDSINKKKILERKARNNRPQDKNF